jgi:hypothetical protein
MTKRRSTTRWHTRKFVVDAKISATSCASMLVAKKNSIVRAHFLWFLFIAGVFLAAPLEGETKLDGVSNETTHGPRIASGGQVAFPTPLEEAEKSAQLNSELLKRILVGCLREKLQLKGSKVRTNDEGMTWSIYFQNNFDFPIQSVTFSASSKYFPAEVSANEISWAFSPPLAAGWYQIALINDPLLRGEAPSNFHVEVLVTDIAVQAEGENIIARVFEGIWRIKRNDDLFLRTRQLLCD